MKTFQHKTLQVLATLTEKTVWMSTLQGKIYKQFPLQFWNEAQFENDPIPFPADWDTALAHFKQSEARKRAEHEAKMAEDAERRLLEAQKEYEERKRLTLILWNARKQVMTEGSTKIYALVVNNGNDTEDDKNYKVCDGYPMWFGDKDSAIATYSHLLSTLSPEFGREMEVSVWEHNMGSDLIDFCSSDDLKSIEYYQGNDIKIDWVSHRNYRSIEGAVIVWWQWITYTGYCRKFIQLEIGEHGKTEQDIISGNNDRVFKDNATVLAYAEDLKGLSEADKISLILGRLDNLGRWEYRKQHPCREDVESIIGMLNIS